MAPRIRIVFIHSPVDLLCSTLLQPQDIGLARAGVGRKRFQWVSRPVAFAGPGDPRLVDLDGLRDVKSKPR